LIFNYRYIIDEHGNVVPEPDLMKWAEWCERHHPCHVARTDLPNGLTVSTVFLAMDHGAQYLPHYERELFETMAYRLKLDEGEEWDQAFEPEQWRYPTWERAAAGHLAAVEEMSRRYPVN
jgi:hypothetical protein